MIKKGLFRLTLLFGCLLAVVLLAASGRPAAEAAQTSPFPIPGWITYLNIWRTKVDLPNVKAHLPFSQGSYDHSVYMLETGHLAHYEEPDSEWYTDEGNAAAWRSNIAASQALNSDFLWAIDYWVSAPFHLIPIIDPKLELVGYGMYHRENEEGLQMTANLDVWNGRLDEVPADITYPIMFPPDGGETWVIRHSLFEFPSPFNNCEEYQNPSGPGIVILLGDGSQAPTVTAHSFSSGDEVLASCVFHEATYTSDDTYEQLAGRQILAERDAVVIMPKEPLELEKTYTASVTADGETYTWTFTTIRPPERLKEILAGN